jgi:large repetitive protein
LVGGHASFTTSALSAGTHNVTAQYNGDLRYSGSTSAPLSQTVVFATSTSLSSSQNPSVLGASVTFTATVLNVPAGAPGPTGTVTFTDNGSPVGSPVSLSGGVATRSIAFSTAVSHFIQATYNGDSLHNPSNSPTLHQLVQSPGVGLSIGSNSPNPVTIGNLVTITTTVSNTSGSDGTYTFKQELAGRFVFVTASASQGSCSGTGPVSCNLGTIIAGRSASVTTQLRALFGHDIVVTNSATTSGGTTSTINNLRVRFRPFHF